VSQLFLCSFPGALTFSVPAGVLMGVLVGLSRMSADSELIALNAVGIGLRRLLAPIGLIAVGALGVTLGITLWLNPLSIHILRTLENRLATTQASFQVQPRVFDERFPHLVLYVQDVSAAATQWRGVFLAESGTGDTSRLTLAEDAIVVPDRSEDKLQVHLKNGSAHEFSLQIPAQYNYSSFAQRDFTMETTDLTAELSRDPSNAERSLGALAAMSGPAARPARIEYHSRLAFPVACLVFALAAIPLGARSRRSSRSAGLIIASLFVFAYYGVFVLGAGLARVGTLPPWLGVWAANIASGLGGMMAMVRIERSQGTGWLGHAIVRLTDWFRWPWNKAPTAAVSREQAIAPIENDAPRNVPEKVFPRRRVAARDGLIPERRRMGGSLPQLLDFYVLRSFLFYFLLVLFSFIALYEIVQAFNLSEELARQRTPIGDVMDYFIYLADFLVYQFAPEACLVAALVTLGVMAKNNELVAFKAAGISLYRIAVPLVLAGALVAAGLIVFDSTYLPEANQRQGELYNRIKGRPAQTFYQPRRQWIFGNNSKVYNYQLYDRDHQSFGGLNVFELDPATFQVRRRVYAARAQWEEKQDTWILESGWVRDFQGGQVTRYTAFPVLELPELDEPPSYFNREVRQSYQMNWFELKQYIAELGQAGFDVARLGVQLQEKLSFPLIAALAILLAVPFSILVGTRGAVGGLAMGLMLSFIFRGLAAVSEAVGAVGQLPPAVAAWSPDIIFGLLGLYFFLNMPT
jgi:LPS export ABC transporter permease LptG/LPS export ABC transporter permease LptF